MAGGGDGRVDMGSALRDLRGALADAALDERELASLRRRYRRLLIRHAGAVSALRALRAAAGRAPPVLALAMLVGARW